MVRLTLCWCVLPPLPRRSGAPADTMMDAHIARPQCGAARGTLLFILVLHAAQVGTVAGYYYERNYWCATSEYDRFGTACGTGRGDVSVGASQCLECQWTAMIQAGIGTQLESGLRAFVGISNKRSIARRRIVGGSTRRRRRLHLHLHLSSTTSTIGHLHLHLHITSTTITIDRLIPADNHLLTMYRLFVL
jgi:hypothetical protein